MTTPGFINCMTVVGGLFTFPLIIVGLFVPFVIWLGLLATLYCGIWLYISAKNTTHLCHTSSLKPSYGNGLTNSTLAFAILTPLMIIVGAIIMAAGGFSIIQGHLSIWTSLVVTGLALAGAILCNVGALGFGFIFYIIYLVQCVQLRKTVVHVQQVQSQPVQEIVVAYPGHPTPVEYPLDVKA